MRLSKCQIKEFRSVQDSGEFEVGHVTCLVGKNEAGKTSLLQALYRLNPIIPEHSTFDVTDDYPRADVENYRQALEGGERNQAVVVRATFTLDEAEVEAIEDELGPNALKSPTVVVSKGYDRNTDGGQHTLFVHVNVNEKAIAGNLLERLPESGAGPSECRTLDQLHAYLIERAEKQKEEAKAAKAQADAIADPTEKDAALREARGLGESEEAKNIRTLLAAIKEEGGCSLYCWRRHLQSKLPQFLYFDEYYQLTGHDNIQALKQRKEAKKLRDSDHPLLGLIELARLDLEKIIATTRTQTLKSSLQGASNFLTGKIVSYWSQNKHLQMSFDVRPGLPEDPEGMRQGLNIWGEVYDMKHLVSTDLGSRSRGFVWFFSFLAWYSSIKKKKQPLVLLLDEPGLSLHGKAQEDLLKYFEAEIASNPDHQLIYSTHSPFMVDVARFDRVRIVQDRSIDTDDELPPDQAGTKVLSDVLDAGEDSLFPLQGALGYEVHQSLFIGPNSLVVEGVSDLIFLQTLSAILQESGADGLDNRWVITPVGGLEKVPTFVSLIGAQKSMNLAVLTDYKKSDQQLLENLYKRKLLKKKSVLTYADFTGSNESDAEDMFETSFYLQLVELALGVRIAEGDLSSKSPRIVVRLAEHFKHHPPKQSYNHFAPARTLAENVGTLTVPESTLDRFKNLFLALNALLPKKT